MTVCSKGSMLRASFSRTTDPSEDGEIFDSDDDGLPSLMKILVHAKQAIDITLDDDQESNGNEDNVTEVDWFRITRTAPYSVRLISPSLIDRFQIVDQSFSP